MTGYEITLEPTDEWRIWGINRGAASWHLDTDLSDGAGDSGGEE